jgi:hypothetical protein
MMTAPTPITMPSIVRRVRILFFRMLSPATGSALSFSCCLLGTSSASSLLGLRLQEHPQILGGVVPVLHGMVVLDASVAYLDDALAVLGQRRLVCVTITTGDALIFSS